VTGPGETVKRYGRPYRHFPVAVSVGSQGLAWARQENAPHGAAVVVDHEINALGRIGSVWPAPPDRTLALAFILRPPLSVEQANAAWLAAAVGTAEGAEAVAGLGLATWWPDHVVHRDGGARVAALKAEVLLGPGEVKAAVVSIRVDLEPLGLEKDRREELLEAILSSLDTASAQLADGADGAVNAYNQRCSLLGLRVKITLLPKGETRGTARRVDRMGRLELESATGMVERVTIDQLRSFEVV
jgi:BirA family biotin operon repressor/biotin-[acetyl-CoA-carboxylase] ligase